MKATIIGGGIIGLSTAYYLQQEGWEVTILERGDLTDGCSFGNMGYLSPSHFAPLAQPGVVSQGIMWMFWQKSPFYVRPALSRNLLDWGLKFVRACTAENVARGARPMAELLLLSRDLTAAWQQSGEMQFEFTPTGCINYFQTAKYEKGELENVRMGHDLGLKIKVLSREECQAIEPELQPEVRGGAWYQDDAILYPNELMRQLANLLESRGVKILRNTEVVGVQKQQGKISALEYRRSEPTSGPARFQKPYSSETPMPGSGEQHTIQSDLFVLAAGSWSQPIAKMAGEYLPMMPGKGYSMTVDIEHQPLRHPCILLEAKVAITPWAKRLRIGSTMEIGAVNDRILAPRVQGILEAVPRFFPAYAQEPGFVKLADPDMLQKHLRERVWYGFRPLSTDGLPYIGFAPKTANLMIATGHAMLGLSMAAATGKLVSEMASGKSTSMDVQAFGLGRLG
ncbi:MAG: FAD-dependent oxidoreductase [Chitinophagales bacterium]|nr:FAD-dependent oxidoreductase [Chitinophagales bacterium]